MTVATEYDLDACRTLTIDDFLGDHRPASPKRSEKRAGKAVGRKKKQAVVSSFKLSNKIAQQELNPNKKAKERQVAVTNDILELHRDKVVHFQSLQDTLPERRLELQRCLDPIKRNEMEKEIAAIENREEEFSYYL